MNRIKRDTISIYIHLLYTSSIHPIRPYCVSVHKYNMITTCKQHNNISVWYDWYVFLYGTIRFSTSTHPISNYIFDMKPPPSLFDPMLPKNTTTCRKCCMNAKKNYKRVTYMW